MRKQLRNIWAIVAAAVAGYLAWNLWYYYPERQKRNRTFEFI
jgi:hypothetical protein